MFKSFFYSLIPLFAICLAGCSKTTSEDSQVKVIGGQIADYHGFMVGLSNYSSDKKVTNCGGSLIEEGVVLTAAHCVTNLDDTLKVSVGIANENEMSSHNSAKVRAITIHEGFNPETMDNDVALLFIDPIDHSLLANPIAQIALNIDSELPQTGGRATVIGWGNESSFGALFGGILRQADVPIVPLPTCRMGGDLYRDVSNHQICAGDFARGGIDSCQGDSGGPLISHVGDHPVLVGIVSWGLGCADKEKPGVYTRISAYTDWIQRQILAHQTPVTDVNSNTLADEVRRHCYGGFMSKELPYPEDPEFKVVTTYQFEKNNYLNSSQAAPVVGAALSTCEFYKAGLGKVLASIHLKNNGNVITVTRKDENTNENQTWTGNTTAEKGLELTCIDSDSKVFNIKFRGTFASNLVFDSYYFVDDQIHSPRLYGFEFSPCTSHGTAFAFGKKMDTVTDQYTYMLKLKSKEIGMSTRYFELNKEPMADSAEISATVTLEANSRKRGLFSLSNNLDQDIHTWELVCPFGMTLTDSAGVKHPAKRVEDRLFSHKFVHSTNQNGKIAAKDSLTFGAESFEDFSQTNLQLCKINGVSVRFSLKND